MPYKIKHRGSGYKVTTPNHPQGFSKHPMSKQKAVAQLRAIKMNTNESLAEAIVNQLLEGPTPADLEAKKLGAFQIKLRPFGGLPYKYALWRGDRGDMEKAYQFVAWLKARHYPEDTGNVGPVPFAFPVGPGNAEWTGVAFLEPGTANRESDLTPPAKAIYFSGAGYSGQGMHAVGGGGGEYGGGLAVG